MPASASRVLDRGGEAHRRQVGVDLERDQRRDEVVRHAGRVRFLTPEDERRGLPPRRRVAKGTDAAPGRCVSSTQVTTSELLLGQPWPHAGQQSAQLPFPGHRLVTRAGDQGQQAGLVEQVDRAQGDARGDVVEARADPLDRHAGQPRPAQPVGGQLHGRGGELGARRRRAGLPVDDLEAAVGVGEDRVDPAAQRQRAERRLERHLDLGRLAVGPLAGEERLLQLGERAVGRGELVAGAGQLVEVDQLRRAEPLLQPGVERRAPPGLRRGGRGHRAAQPAGQLGGVAAQGDQRRHRQVRGQRDVDRRAGVPGAARAAAGRRRAPTARARGSPPSSTSVGVERVRRGRGRPARRRRSARGAVRTRAGRPARPRPATPPAPGWSRRPRARSAQCTTVPAPSSQAWRAVCSSDDGPHGFTPSRHQLPEQSSRCRARVTAT